MFFRAGRLKASACKGLLWSFTLAAFLFCMVISANAQEEGYVPLTDEFDEKQFVGKKISMDLQDAELKTVLRMIADISGYNIVAGDDVSGKITLKLDNVPWDQALDLILRTRKLGMEKEANIIRIAPQSSLTAEAQAKIADRQAKLLLEELILELIPVSYGDASKMMNQIRPLLSTRGVAQVDDRTNVIVIKDVKKHIQEAKKLIKSLDSQTPQVLIEARVVEASTDFTRELGIKWGGN